MLEAMQAHAAAMQGVRMRQFKEGIVCSSTCSDGAGSRPVHREDGAVMMA